jgi:hypothetical protein
LNTRFIYLFFPVPQYFVSNHKMDSQADPKPTQSTSISPQLQTHCSTKWSETLRSWTVHKQQTRQKWQGKRVSENTNADASGNK